ncbi:hypothetical protein Gohar_003311 [Gossypium harknessii]|uniref:Uncharacterized protein n=1 Tax=Gossypium harknessii TaxID=34285 RepID=A0A7J9HNK8_9ROSI|nr:hypothetical protein [Gossypium harknessii]
MERRLAYVGKIAFSKSRAAWQ